MRAGSGRRTRSWGPYREPRRPVASQSGRGFDRGAAAGGLLLGLRGALAPLGHRPSLDLLFGEPEARRKALHPLAQLAVVGGVELVDLLRPFIDDFDQVGASR